MFMRFHARVVPSVLLCVVVWCLVLSLDAWLCARPVVQHVASQLGHRTRVAPSSMHPRKLQRKSLFESGAHIVVQHISLLTCLGAAAYVRNNTSTRALRSPFLCTPLCGCAAVRLRCSVFSSLHLSPRTTWVATAAILELPPLMLALSLSVAGVKSALQALRAADTRLGGCFPPPVRYGWVLVLV